MVCLALLAACGGASTGASDRIRTRATPSDIPLTSTLSTPTDSWAVVAMGHLRQPLNTFWQMFVTPGHTRRWALVTPPGVADNGGLVMAAPAAGRLVTGFRPSQELAVSPVETSDHPGRWVVPASSAPVPDGGLADLPDVLSSGASGALALALGSGGDSAVLAGTSGLAGWHQVTSLGALAAQHSVASCDLTELTGVAITDAGGYVAGACASPGVAAVLRLGTGAGSATLAGPTSPAWAHDDIQVIRLTDTAGRLATLLRLTSGGRVSYAAAWTRPGSSDWRVSPTLTAGGTLVSTGIGATGGFVVETAGARGTGPQAAVVTAGGAWTRLPSLPLGTTAVADSVAGPVALVTGANTFADYRLTSAHEWARAESFGVSIPYGSSN